LEKIFDIKIRRFGKELIVEEFKKKTLEERKNATIKEREKIDIDGK
jgi:hypothetical protein